MAVGFCRSWPTVIVFMRQAYLTVYLYLLGGAADLTEGGVSESARPTDAGILQALS
jgi:hypothetical protein